MARLEIIGNDLVFDEYTVAVLRENVPATTMEDFQYSLGLRRRYHVPPSYDRMVQGKWRL